MRHSACLIPLLLLASCSREPRIYEADYIGVKDREQVVEAIAGQVEVAFYANRPGHIRALDEAGWARFETTRFSGNGTFTVDYEGNEGFPRRARIELALDGYPWRDTLSIKQKGTVEERLVPGSTGVIVYNGHGDTTIPLDTNLNPAALDLDLKYETDDTPWVTDVQVTSAGLVLQTRDNTDDRTRSAVLTVSYRNGWGETVSCGIRLTQATADNLLGTEIPLADLSALAAENDGLVTGKYVITGYIVSDPSTGNLADNPRVTSTAIDYTATQKAAYLESLDGTRGVMLVTATVEDNIFQPGTRVQLLIQGATVIAGTDPDRVVLEGVKGTMLVSSEPVAEADIPVKERHIGDLTDDDLYTLVTLTDVEFPIRKGGLTPVHDGYTNAGGAHRVSKFPTLLRCKDGGSLYLLTNTTCPYRRDGTRPGDGAGTVKGILVHERYRPFREGDNPDENLCGNIGRYQIRHQHKEDIALATRFADSFSGIVAEWRYMTDGAATDGWMPATQGAGLLTHTHPSSSLYSTFHTNMYHFQEFSYLGPCGTDETLPFGKHLGNENGLGIYLDSGVDYSAGDTAINKDGKGGGTSSRGYAWAQDYWWDNSSQTPWGWLVRFSTRGLSTDVLSLQVSMLNMSQSGYTPLEWRIEYSLDREEWTLLDRFTVPDLVLWNLTLDSQSAGAKPMDFPLPTSLLGQDDVYIRLCPDSNVASDTKAYANAVVTYASGRRSVMNYLAIRYNR